MGGVLIIEDSRELADLLRDLFEMLHVVDVDVAYDGAAGIEKARRQVPAIILCDLGLPGVDGYAVARTLRADVALSGSRLVAWSGSASAGDRTRARDAGFDLHLTKPVESRLFEELVAAAPGVLRGR